MRFLLAALVVVTLGCSATDDGDSRVADDGLASGESAEADAVRTIADGFDGPTQIVDGPDGRLVVAQLAGGEGEGRGEVVSFDPTSGAREVVLDGLDKPTGVLWLDGELWVMVRRGLVRATWDGVGPASAVEVVLDDLPFNGRSQGTLTAMSDGRFLYDTSGSRAGGEVVAGSGTLWVFDPDDRSSTAVAVGAKHAYAHAFADDGALAVTEISDASPAPVDELNVLSAQQFEAALAGSPIDLGWPRCPGDDSCAGVIDPAATFAPATTPTGVAVIGDVAYVALFVSGELVRVPLAGGDPTVVADGLAGIHTVLARADGSLWLTDHLGGRILELDPS